MSESSKRARPDFLDPFPIDEYELFSDEPLGRGAHGVVDLFRRRRRQSTGDGQGNLTEFVAVKDIPVGGEQGHRDREIQIMQARKTGQQITLFNFLRCKISSMSWLMLLTDACWVLPQ